jgi:hypothetical protein
LLTMNQRKRRKTPTTPGENEERREKSSNY